MTTASYDSNLSNNKAWAWAYNYSATDYTFREVLGNYTVDVSVDDLAPAPGEEVDCTITAGRTNPYTGSSGTSHTPPPIDLKVDIDLTDGLTVTGTPTYGPTTNRADSVIYSNGVFTIGTLQQGKERTNSVTLPITVGANAVVNELCLTATLTGKPPPGTRLYGDDPPDNVAKLCLGEPPDRIVLFNSGETGLLTRYNCVGRTAYPCSTMNSVEFVVLGGTAAYDFGLPYQVFKPDKVIIHVPDPSSRAASSEDGSSDLVWSTGYDTGVVIRPGVVLTEEMGFTGS